MKKPTDINEARLRRLAQQPYIDVQFDDPTQWLSQVVEDGVALPHVTGIHFGMDGLPGVIINAEQCRAFAEALLKVAEHLDPEPGDESP